MTKWFVYMVSCSDNSIYTGITTNISRRIIEHNNKIGAKSLYGKLPVVLVHKETFLSQIEAAKKEREIQRWSHNKKVMFINGNRNDKKEGISAVRLGTFHRA